MSAELPARTPHRLTPAGVLLWRSASSVQLEIGPHRLIVDGLDGAAIRELLSDPAQEPANEPNLAVGQLRTQLGEQGYLWPADDDFVPPAPRLAGELTALSARFGQDAAELMWARSRRTVVVQGSGQAGSLVASLLAAAGVGRVHVLDRVPTRLAHAVPGGVRPADEGTPLTDAAATAIRAAAPEVDVTAPPLGHSPDIVILAIDDPVDTDCRDALHAREAAHLAVSVAPTSGIVGPLVIPGVSSCLACTDLHRRDRDAAWPALAAQLGVRRRYARTGEIAVCAAIAGVAAGQALAFLDGELPTTLEATLELHPPDWRVRRRSWPAHPDCGCMSA